MRSPLIRNTRTRNEPPRPLAILYCSLQNLCHYYPGSYFRTKYICFAMHSHVTRRTTLPLLM